MLTDSEQPGYNGIMAMLKKLLIIPFIIFTFSSCSLLFRSDNDIWIKNECDFDIEIYLTQSSKDPPAYVPINRNEMQKFTRLDTGNYYVHITSSDYSYAPSDSRKKYHPEIYVRKDGYWNIKWSYYDKKYKVTSF